MSGLSLSLLGAFTAAVDGETLKFRSNRGQALLIYLVTERVLGGETHRRESLMELLWPGMPQKSAQVNLRQTLYQLRQGLPPIEVADANEPAPLLNADRQLVGLDDRYPITSDLEAFIALLAGPEEEWPDVADLYRGDFLADFFLPDANSFEEWAAARRAAFRRQALDALDTLTTAALQSNDLETAEGYARRQLAIDNLRESAHRQLMRALALTGQRSQALAQYSVVKELLETELGAEPSAETEALYQQLLSGEPLAARKPGAVGERHARVVGPCPYRGLAAFREEDTSFFFGRDQLIEQLVEAVRQRALVHVIVGSSGSGKSSVVYAGLLPRLREDGSWLIAQARPGSQPFQATAAALLTLLEPELSEADRLIETRKLSHALTEGEVNLDDVARRTLEKEGESDRLLLLLDQFEEIYTLCPDDELRRRFLDQLLAAVESSGRQRTPPLVFLLTLRADFMGQALSHRPFADALQDAAFMIGPMNVEELQLAIEKPAELQGAVFEEGLVSRILNDVGQEPGHLPLLEFALTLLWEKQQDGWLTHADYEAIGQVEGALTHYADDVVEDLDESEREQARQIFVQLVRPGQGTEDTRRVATRAELGEAHWPLVRHLADCRLVVTGRDESDQETAEVVHEALIQSWDRLQEWMAADRVFRTWQERLRAGLGSWEASGSDEGALLRGGPLAEAEGWLAERGEQMSAAEQAFIEASVELRERREQQREARRRRELETAQELAKTQSRAAAGMRRRAYLLAGAGLIAIILAVVAFSLGRQAVRERQAAREQAEVALSRELARAAENNLDVDTELSVLLALEAVNTAKTWEAEGALHNALGRFQLLRTLTGHTWIVRSVAYSPDGSRLATVSLDQVKVWDVDSGEEIFTLETDINTIVAVFNPDGTQLVVGKGNGILEIWDLASGNQLQALEYRAIRERGMSDAVMSIAFSHDGKQLVGGYSRQSARVWDVESGQYLSLAGHAPPGTSGYDFAVAINSDGTRLVTAGADGTVRLWDMASDQEEVVLLAAGLEPLVSSTSRALPLVGSPQQIGLEPIRQVAADLDANGTRVAAAVSDGTVGVWEVSPDFREATQTFTINESVSALAFSPDSTRLATIGREGVARIWDASTGRELLILAGHASAGTAVAFSPDGRTLATGNEDKTVKIWEAVPGRELVTLVGKGLNSIALSPGGERLISAGESIIMWDIRSGQQLWSLNAQDVQRIALSPDGSRLAVARTPTDGYSVSIWDIAAGRELYQLPMIPATTLDLEYSPDGSILVTSDDTCVTRIWHLASRRVSYTIRQKEPQGDGCIRDSTFSSDGNYLVSGSTVNTITVREVESGEIVLTMAADTEIVSVAIDPKGTYIAAGEADGDVTVWDISGDEGRLFFSLPGHSGFVEDLAFSPDGKLLASAGADTMVKVWDLSPDAVVDQTAGDTVASREMLALSAHHDIVVDVLFSPDGKRLISASQDGTVRVYTLDLEELVELARDRVTRGLTTEECQRYLHVDSCPERGS